jgi:starch phosphorylase
MKTPTNQMVPELETAAEGENGNLRRKTEVENGKTAVKTQTESRVVSAKPTGSNELSKLIEQYGCGPVQFTGTNDALYERHLVFDNVMDAAAIGPRERFEALGRSVRDVLSQRWIRTEETYDRKDPKRVYYLSMEFLIGRSLANNVTNLLLDDITKTVLKEQRLNWYELLEKEPDAGLGNGGLGRLAACFLDSMATMEIPAMGYGLRYQYGMFKQTIQDGWQQLQTTGCVVLILGRSVVKTRR